MSVLLIKYDFLNVWTLSFMAMFISIKCKWSNKNHSPSFLLTPVLHKPRLFLSQMYKCKQYFGFIFTNWGRPDQNNNQEIFFCTFLHFKFNSIFHRCIDSYCLTSSCKSHSHSGSWHHHRIRRSGDPGSQWRMISKAKMVEPCGTYGSKWFITSVYHSGLWSSWEKISPFSVNNSINMRIWNFGKPCASVVWLRTKTLSCFCFFFTVSKTAQAPIRGQIQAYWLITNTQSLTNLLSAGSSFQLKEHHIIKINTVVPLLWLFKP